MHGESRCPDVDAYIEQAGDFAKPILLHLRERLHAICPQVDESLKWGIPHFDYCGQFMCMMAAYSGHCSFTFWKQALMSDPRLRENPSLKANKRYLGNLKVMSDLPPEPELTSLIKEAMKLNEERVELPERAPKQTAEIAMPEAFRERLAANDAVRQIFESRSPSFRKEYLVWISQAKTEATRDKRIAESLAWIAEGKSRFWKYQK
ncbi:YdeI family protein [Sphingosinicella sp. CPCC 101087]|uniref:YdeI/OmpD-associated family protein n=1 Tax=Sphingosinicella sp. CPCC 101087 TaxID=2497754 RepID=UPI00101B751C|nr:YdeI/OmpD-associated family protein [Sphingosinicella sp. CPCC 101087]